MFLQVVQISDDDNEVKEEKVEEKKKQAEEEEETTKEWEEMVLSGAEDDVVEMEEEEVGVEEGGGMGWGLGGKAVRVVSKRAATAVDCNRLQQTATDCNTLQHTDVVAARMNQAILMMNEVISIDDSDEHDELQPCTRQQGCSVLQ